MPRKIIPVGARFTRLQVVAAPVAHRTPSGYLYYLYPCVCDCGNRTMPSRKALVDGRSMSCGCLFAETRGQASTTHGMRHTRTWDIWQHMLNRCRNPNIRDWKHYGGRGITVCERWHKFEHFFADMGECPAGLSLDRWPNNEGNYEPGNCRWATDLQQARNCRSNTIYTVAGITDCLTALCERLGAKYHMIKARLQRGWTVEAAFTEPPRGLGCTKEMRRIAHHEP